MSTDKAPKKAHKTTSSRAKKTTRPHALYSNLTQKRKERKDHESRKRAEYRATLPKDPVKRFMHRMHPKRFWGYWFSKEGGRMALKIAGISILVVALFVGGLFAYFRKDLDQIRPGEIDKRVQSTVTKYTDRNGTLLWEDKGDSNYRLVVKSEDISQHLKDATVSIEDRNFFKHGGLSFTGTFRAMVNNFTGGSTQGGSTLTQQLVKQVFLSEESGNRGLGGIPRKIKELILAVEIERMYNKDQILTLYLNESPYGGRRNGAESGAQTYFGKSAKNLTVAEAALLAAIPQNPTVFDPYNVAGHDGLVQRQHHVLVAMKEEGYITQKEYDEAIAVPILDNLKLQSSQFEGIRAPHFVQMVRSQLEKELGKATVGRGGLTVKTTLDVRIQDKLEESMTDMFKSTTPNWAGFSNGAATVADTKTGQIIALMGSRDFSYEGFGQDNAATAYIQPGSSIKPLVFTQLFQQKPEGQQNFGSGTILVDEPIDKIYGSKLQNADRRYIGNATIRTSLATSRNVPAVKAMNISGVEPTIKEIRDLGAKSYCTVGADRTASLAAAIGGCGLTQVDLVNAYTSVARGGVYKQQSSILEVKNSSGETLKKWTDTAGKRIIDEQSAYIVSDILSDQNASAALGNYAAKRIPGVKTATKTGTSDKGGFAKDLWMFSYSPALTMGVWLGNPDTTILKNGTSSIGSPIVASVMQYAHQEVYGPEGKWKTNDWYAQPQGIQRIGKEVYPSWWNKNQGLSNAKIVFDKVSKKKATDCTPEGARIEVSVTKSKDPVTKKDVYSGVPAEYNYREDDDAHSCGDAKPSASLRKSGNSFTITVVPGKFGVDGSGVTASVNGTTVSLSKSGNEYTGRYPEGSSDGGVSVSITDTGFYTFSQTLQ
ncbi:penicillin-binding protein [Candidatus Saccharibacteria bacterium TM7i]|nr:penicillin-binding protein [Candidatus Saccharibacteria bacterium TM7i]